MVTHTHTDREQYPQHRHTHNKNNSPNPQTSEGGGKKINRSHTHTHTPTENNTPDTDTHTPNNKNNTPNPQTSEGGGDHDILTPIGHPLPPTHKLLCYPYPYLHRAPPPPTHSAADIGLTRDIRFYRGFCARINPILRKHLLCLGTPLPPLISHTSAQCCVSPDPPLLQYIPYNIGNGNIV